MKALSLLHPPPPLPNPPPFRPPAAAPLRLRRQRLAAGSKGFASTRPGKGKKPSVPRKPEIDDDRIPDVVWDRMIRRILLLVGVPIGLGFALLQGMNLLQEHGIWNVPKAVPYATTFVTFGTSAIGIAYGSLSTSLDADKKGSLLGLEQLEKNWNEMWMEEDETGEEGNDRPSSSSS
ncbi:uncharacterized protein PAM68-like [Andrographis paniculata]|uniref:uncharacterized protein PAM68-like n=1 Tax=Andrographis paniculata TaxID=175694 RepID=UPI0021E8315E|nr:uncharacterized protein PAM68-like [Andrographis paniculata]